MTHSIHYSAHHYWHNIKQKWAVLKKKVTCEQGLTGSVQWQIQYFPRKRAGHQLQRWDSQPILLATFPQKLHGKKKR